MSAPGRLGLLRAAAGLAAASVRLPWTLALWSVEQAVGMADPSRPWSRTTTAFDELASSAREPLGRHLGAIERGGGHLQRDLIDLALRFVGGPESSEPARFDRAWSALERARERPGGAGGIPR